MTVTYFCSLLISVFINFHMFFLLVIVIISCMCQVFILAVSVYGPNLMVAMTVNG